MPLLGLLFGIYLRLLDFILITLLYTLFAYICIPLSDAFKESKMTSTVYKPCLQSLKKNRISHREQKKVSQGRDMSEHQGFSSQYCEPMITCPIHSKAKQTKKSEFGVQKGFFARATQEEQGKLMPKSPELPKEFQRSILKDKVREKSLKVCDQFLNSSPIG